MDEFALQGLTNMSNGLINLANSIGASNLNRTNREFSERMTKQQQEWSKSMYDYTFKKATDYAASYNSPSAQLRRLIDAGINPNSAAAVVGGSSSSQGSPVLPSAGMASYQSVFHPLDTSLNPTQSLLDVAARKEALRGQKIENDYKAQGLELTQAEQSQRLSLIDEQLRKLRIETDLSNENLNILRQSAAYLVAKNRSDADSAQQTFKNLVGQLDNLRAEKREIEARTDNYKEDSRYKSIVSDYTDALNNLRSHLIEIGVDPEARGADRFLEFILDSEDGRNAINKLLKIASSPSHSLSPSFLSVSHFRGLRNPSDKRSSGIR